MRTRNSSILLLILLLFNCSIALAQYPPASRRSVEKNQVPPEHQYGDNQHPNYIKVTSPDGSRTFYFDEVTLVQNNGYTLHFPLFGIKPELPGRGQQYPIADLVSIKPDYFDQMSQISIQMSPDSTYAFPRNQFADTDCVLTGRFIWDFWNQVTESEKGNVTHTVSQSGRNKVIDFSARSDDFPGYRFEAHVEARPVKAKNNDDPESIRVYHHRQLDVISYPGEYQQFFVPSPNANNKSAVIKYGGEILYYAFDRFSDKAIRFKKYKLNNRIAGNYDVITPPLKTGNPDPGKLSVQSGTPEATISSAQVINLRGTPLFIAAGNRPEGARDCTREYMIEVNTSIGIADLPAKQEIAWTKQPFQSFEMINNSLNGFTVNASSESVSLSYKNYLNLAFETRYNEIIENAGDRSDELIRYLSVFNNPLVNKRGNAEIPEDWKEIVNKLGVEGELQDNPRLYLPAVLQNYDLEKQDLLIVHYMLTKEEYPELKKDVLDFAAAFNDRDEDAIPDIIARMNGRAGIQVDESKPLPDQAQQLNKNIEYAFPWLESERTGTDVQTFTVNPERRLASFSHTKSFMNLTGSLQFEYDEKQVSATVKQNKEVLEKFTFEATAGLFNLSFLIPSLTAMDLDKLNEKVLYATELGTRLSKRTGRIKGARFVLYQATLSNQGEETINYLGKEIETNRVTIAFSKRPEFSIPFKHMAGYSSEDGRHVAKIWLDQDSQLPVKMEVGYETYWLVPKKKAEMEAWVAKHMKI